MKKIKKLGYGVAIHYNEYQKIFEVYKLGTYYPSDPSINKDAQMLCRDVKLKKAVKKYMKGFR